MAWGTPVTNWTADSYFNSADATRLVVNLNYLYDAIIAAGGRFTLGWIDLDGISTGYNSILTADDYTKIEWDLWHCARATRYTLGCSRNFFPTYKAWGDNGATPDYQRLNQVETAMLNIYNYLQSL